MTTAAVLELVRVVVLAGDPLSQSGVVGALKGQTGLCLVPDREAGRVDVVVCVIDDGESGERLVRRSLAGGAHRAVAVVQRLDDAGLLALVDAGAGAVLRRSEATPDALAGAIRAVHSGEGALPADLVGRLLGHLQRLGRDVLAPRGVSVSGLTTREREVLVLLADGADTKSVAQQLRQSERTIKSVVHDLTTRFGAVNRTHVVACALRAGLIS